MTIKETDNNRLMFTPENPEEVYLVGLLNGASIEPCNVHYKLGSDVPVKMEFKYTPKKRDEPTD